MTTKPDWFEEVKRAAREVLEEHLRDIGLHGSERFLAGKERKDVLDGIAHDIAGRLVKEAM